MIDGSAIKNLVWSAPVSLQGPVSIDWTRQGHFNFPCSLTSFGGKKTRFGRRVDFAELECIRESPECLELFWMENFPIVNARYNLSPKRRGGGRIEPKLSIQAEASGAPPKWASIHPSRGSVL